MASYPKHKIFHAGHAVTRSRTSQSGFTYIEIAVAVMILLTLAAVVAPRLAPAADAMRQKASASALSAIASSARHASVLDKKTCVIRCPADENRCDLSCEQPDKNNKNKMSETILKTHAWKQGGPARTRDGEGDAAIYFFPDGTASGPAIQISGENGSTIVVEVFESTALPYIYEIK